MGKRWIVTLAVALVAGAVAASPRPSSAAAIDAEAGKKVFNDNCTACHTAMSTDRNVGPGLKGLYKNGKMPSSGKPVNDANVRKQILEGGNGMPGFKSTLSAAQVDDLLAYLKTV